MGAPEIYGYGEDALTFWAVSNQLTELLKRLDDNSAEGDCIVFFRPSFGRKGNPKPESNSQTPRAEFGEFDAVLGTPKAVYLIETKRATSRGPNGRMVKLDDVQIHRHNVFRHYLRCWREHKPTDWETFQSICDGDFRALFAGNKMPKSGDLLTENLTFVLHSLERCGERIVDVCLYVARTDEIKPTDIEPSTFSLVVLRFMPIKGASFLRLR